MPSMKTAISVPEPLFRQADRLARKLKISRSELYARAMSAYLRRSAGRAVREKLDEVYSKVPASEQLDAAKFSLEAIRKVLEREEA